MKSTRLLRSALPWCAAILVSGTIAGSGSYAVLADPNDPACVDADPATMPADGSGCEAPAPPPAPEPAPEPAPAPEPEPAPAPAPEPAPEPAPAPEPETPAAPAPDDGGSEPAPKPDDKPATSPDKPGKPDKPSEDKPSGDEPAGEDTPAAPTPDAAPDKPAPKPSNGGTDNNNGGGATPAPAEDAHVHTDVAAAEAHVAAVTSGGGGDARTFRENYTPRNVVPNLPEMQPRVARTLVGAAAESGVDWSVLAALAWIDSRWGDPVAPGLVGGSLTAAQWTKYGTDGDDNGSVTRASEPDQAATVANLIKTEGVAAGLRAYFQGDARQVEYAQYLADYYDALGVQAATHGLEAAQAELADRVLADKRITIYPAGRSDIQAGLIDPRVLVSLVFLANRFDSVAVSSLVSGHSVFTKAGGVSNHAYGRAADIAALGGRSILGNQQANSVTTRAVKDLLGYPPSMGTDEIISLWNFGGPSFAAGDHADHIHLAFGAGGGN